MRFAKINHFFVTQINVALRLKWNRQQIVLKYYQTLEFWVKIWTPIRGKNMSLPEERPVLLYSCSEFHWSVSGWNSKFQLISQDQVRRIVPYPEMANAFYSLHNISSVIKYKCIMCSIKIFTLQVSIKDTSSSLNKISPFSFFGNISPVFWNMTENHVIQRKTNVFL